MHTKLNLENTLTSYPFLRNSGEMSALTQSYNWAATPVGPIESWDVSLRTTLSLLLSSKFPMLLWWGDSLIQFYNDAYRDTMGNDGKHPAALGQKGVDCWQEIWDTIHPFIEKVRNNGESTWHEDMLLPIYRQGLVQDTYWTFSYSAVPDDAGIIAGVLVVCTETTEKVINTRYLEESKNELEFAIDATELSTWDVDPRTGRLSGNARLKEWFGLAPQDEVPLSSATDVIIDKDRGRVLEAIERVLQYDSGGYYDIEYTIKHPITLQERAVRAKGRAWFNDSREAYRFNGTLQDITAQKKAAEEIARANELTELATTSTGIGLFNVNLLTSEIEFTPAFARIITGDENKKTISRKYFEKYVHPEDVAARAIALEEGNRTGGIFNYSPRVIWDDGSVHRVMVTGSNTHNGQGKPIRFSGTVQDITLLENQRLALEVAEELKRNSDARFRHVTNSSPTGLWLSDQTGGLIYVNKTMADWTGLPYKDLLGTGWLATILEEDRQESIDKLVEAIAVRGHYDVLLRKNKYNTITWCRAAGDPYYDKDGNFAGYAGFCMDVDEIITSRKALAESEEKFRSMIEQAPIATCLFTGSEMTISTANKTMLGYWGNRPVIGKTVAEALPEAEGRPTLGLLMEAYSSGRTQEAKALATPIEIDGLLKTYYFDNTCQPLSDANGVVYGVMLITVDVTEQVLAQQRIEESQKQLLSSFEQAPVGIATISKENLVFTMVNAFYGELADRNSEDIVGKPLLDALPELEGQGFDNLLRQVIDTGKAYAANEVPVTLKRGDGFEEIYVDLTYQPQFSADASVSGVLVVAADVTQQVLSRRKVEQSEARLRSIIAAAPAGIGVFAGRELVVEMPNQTFIDIVGRGRDIVGKPLREAMPELITHGQPFLKILDDVFTTGKMYQSFGDQVKIIQNGVLTYNYYNITYTPLFNENNEVYAILDIAVDVTEQIMARKRLEQSEQQVRALVESAPFPIGAYKGREMRIFLANQSIMDTWGKGSDIVGKLYSEVLPELENQAIYEKLDAVYTTGIPFHARNERVDLVVNGKLTPFYFNYSFTPLYDLEGKVYGVMNTAADVTDLNVAKLKVEQSEANFRNMILQAPVAMCILLGPEHVVDIANDFMLELWGKTAANMLGRPLFEGLPDAREQGLEQLLDYVYNSGDSFNAYERPVELLRNGKMETVYQNFVYEPYKDATGKTVGVLAISIDVTAQVLARHQIEQVVEERTKELAETNALLQQNNEALGQFAYITSHDLQEPVRKITIFSKMLEESLGEVEGRSANYIKKIQIASERMGNLIRDVLHYSQLSKAQDIFEKVDLNRIVGDITSDFELVIEQSGASITHTGLPVIEAIPLQMTQLFGNLISNSLKYTRPDNAPHINISSEVTEDNHGHKSCRITFTDNGIGFEQEYAEKIFNIFQRLHGKSEYSGTGIGLAICKKIVQNHHGEIEASSAKGKGATFHITLPVHQIP
jgi:PAS domain S-box-containing protein